MSDPSGETVPVTEREHLEGLRYEDRHPTVAEVAGRCQESVYPGVCGNWLPCSDHEDAYDNYTSERY